MSFPMHASTLFPSLNPNPKPEFNESEKETLMSIEENENRHCNYFISQLRKQYSGGGRRSDFLLGAIIPQPSLNNNLQQGQPTKL